MTHSKVRDIKVRDQIAKIRYKLLTGLVFLFMLISMPRPVYAQWPPFKFGLTPSYENGQIAYSLTFSSRVKWNMTNVAIKIPLPEGTRFLKANAIPIVDTSFDGTEVTFFISVLSHELEEGDAGFVVEVTDPTLAVFNTHAWVSWQGDQPGDYLTKDVPIDITRHSLDWKAPAASDLQLEAVATSVDDVITYTIYPRSIRESGVRMQDVKINVLIPAETTFISAEASPPFTASFDGQEVSFFALELTKWIGVGPLNLKVSTKQTAVPLATTHAWATWKNVSRMVGRKVIAQEATVSGDIVVQPHTSQWVVSDLKDDVPFANYDITSIALQEVILPAGQPALKIIFHANGDLGPVGDEPLVYNFYIDSDCDVGTGLQQNNQGAEYWVRYDHKTGQASFVYWNEEQRNWDWTTAVAVDKLVAGNVVTVWVTNDLLDYDKGFCWTVLVRDRKKGFTPHLPLEKVPSDGSDLRLAKYEAPATSATIETELPTVAKRSAGVFINIDDIWQYLPGWSEPQANWKAIDFNDDSWFSGPTNIGYGTGHYATDLVSIRPVQDYGTSDLIEHVDKQSGMIVAVLPSGEDVASVFMRRSFTVTDPASLTKLALHVEYEGGFVAYLNGIEVARHGLGMPNEPVPFDTLAFSDETDKAADFDLSNQINNLVSGANVLVMQAHRSENSSNLSIAAKLTWESNPIELAVENNPELASPAVLTPTVRPSLSIADISGKLAVPLDNGQALYDVHIFSMPGGQEIDRILNARQPNFRFDGQRILVNREGGGLENVYEYNLSDNTESQVSDAPQDWHPFYDPWGNRVVYGNAELTVGQPQVKYDTNGEPVIDKNTEEIVTYGPRQPFIFVQCGLLPPHQETEPRCRDIPNLGVLVPAGQFGEIQGTHPVWTSNDMIAYKGCNTWVGSALCGIYIVPSASTKGFSDGFIPTQLTQDTSDIPTDTKGQLIAFMSQRDGNWEVYVMDLNGAGVKNLSNSPNSNDGLATISPDGNWIAFVSDRDGQWAVWVIPAVGGSAQKLFDLPVGTPWGNGRRAWTNERISWGP